jgi:crotonobetainyl-CoA:carnitine CoA-transferase CaiB-like acyl-CoA transferase
VVDRLIERSHAVVENFRPGVLDRLGFGYEALKRRKPDIIYASSSGYGADGPYRDRPGQDLLIQAMSGLAWATGSAADGPRSVGCAAADQHGGALLALGIVGAYARWLSTGEGTRVESSLLGAGIDLQTESLTTYFASGRGAAAFDRDPHLATWFHEAPYGIYRVADGHIALSMNEPAKLAAALDSADLAVFAEVNRYQERDRYARAVAEVLAPYRFAELAARFDAAGVWYAPIDDYEALRVNPQVVHNEAFREVPVGDETVTLVNHPIRYDGRMPGFHGFPWRTGEHTVEILEELGYSDGEIRGLMERKVVFAPDAA